MKYDTNPQNLLRSASITFKSKNATALINYNSEDNPVRVIRGNTLIKLTKVAVDPN